MFALGVIVGLFIGMVIGFGMAALFVANDYGNYDQPDLPNDEEDL